VDQDRNHGKKCSVFKRIKYFLTRQVRMDARLLDFMQEHPEIAPDSDLLEAPPGEFQKILAEMDKRGIKPAVKRQVKLKNSLTNAGRYMHRPAFVALLVVLIIGGSSVGTSAKKAYDYRIREEDMGKNAIVWNNDQYILSGNDKLDKAYKEIESQLGIKPLKMTTVPFDMIFQELKIEHGNALLKFKYNDHIICITQSKRDVTTSNTVVSDRKVYKTIYNIWLEKDINIAKNKLPGGEIEYSSKINLDGAYYYLSGVMDEDDFISLIENVIY
jgi:hypothetical protein